MKVPAPIPPDTLQGFQSQNNLSPFAKLVLDPNINLLQKPLSPYLLDIDKGLAEIGVNYMKAGDNYWDIIVGKKLSAAAYSFG